MEGLTGRAISLPDIGLNALPRLGTIGLVDKGGGGKPVGYIAFPVLGSILKGGGFIRGWSSRSVTIISSTGTSLAFVLFPEPLPHTPA